METEPGNATAWRSSFKVMSGLCPGGTRSRCLPQSIIRNADVARDASVPCWVSFGPVSSIGNDGFPGTRFGTQQQQRKKQPTMKKPLIAGTVLSLLALEQASVFAATGEVTLSGSTWTGKVDGVTKYTGTSMALAGEACNAAMSSGTSNIRNSGNVNGQMDITSNKKVNGNGCTLTGASGFAGGLIGSANSSGVGAQNINMAGTPWYGLYFRHHGQGNPGGVDRAGRAGAISTTGDG
jgi:hypothetical protein